MKILEVICDWQWVHIYSPAINDMTLVNVYQPSDFVGLVDQINWINGLGIAIANLHSKCMDH